MPVAATRSRKRAISSGGSGRARHWPADLVKIWRAWHRDASARSTARGRPPAIDMCAPSLGMKRLRGPGVSLAKHFGVEPGDARAVLPGVAGEAGLQARLTQKLFGSPLPFRRDLRQQQTAPGTQFRNQPMTADRDRVLGERINFLERSQDGN